MRKVASKRRGSNPAGGGTPAPTLPPPLARPKLTPLQQRQRALQACGTNAAVWEIIGDARELREKIKRFVRLIQTFGKDADPARVALESEGLGDMLPWTDHTNFGAGTFHYLVEPFGAIAAKIHEHIGVVCGELPPPPAGLDRRAA